MSKADRIELSQCIAAKLAKRGLIAQPSAYIAKLVASWIEDFTQEPDDAPDAEDTGRADDWKDHHFTRSN